MNKKHTQIDLEDSIAEVISNSKTVVNQLVADVEGFFNVDISSKSRESAVVIARYVFFISARKLGITMQAIGAAVNRSHAMVWKTEKEHDDRMKGDTFYRSSFDAYNNRHIPRVEKDVQIDHDRVVLTQEQELLLMDLSELSDADILDFRQTRLKPYLNMLKSRVKPKVIEEVVGAKLNRY